MTANYGMKIAADESTTCCGKQLASREAGASSYLSVTYNSIPATPAGRSIRPCAAQCPSVTLTNTLRPQLTGSSTDPDGGNLRYDFEVWAGLNPNPTTMVTSGSVSGVPSAAWATWTVPASMLTSGSSYEYRVRSFDGTDYSPWSVGWSQFTVDITAPAAATVTSVNWPAGAWASSGATSGTLSWTNADSSVNSYTYWLDNTMPVSVPSTTLSYAPSGLGQGLHTFHLQAYDKAGNQSQTDYTFGIGNGIVTSPADQDRTQDSSTLSATPPNAVTYPWVRYDWSWGTSGSWTTVPSGNLTVPGGGTPTTNTNNTYALASYPQGLIWKTVNDVTSDGAVQVRACFATSGLVAPTICTIGNTLQVARTAFGASNATSSVGPGQVSLLTGDFSTSSTDASLATYGGSLSVSRTTTTLAPPSGTSGSAGVVGPGWKMSLPDPGSGRTDQTLTDGSSNGYVTLTDATGSTEAFTTTASGYPRNYTAVGDAADGSVLTQTTATGFSVTDPDGTVTTWTSTGAGSTVGMSTVTVPGVGAPTYVFNGSGQPTQVTGQAPPGLSCVTPLTTVGCRSLVFLYGAPSSGDSTLTQPAGMYDATGHLAEIDAVVADPSTGLMTTTPILRYGYDGSGSTARLTGTWDPRISPKLVNRISYDAVGRLSTVTPAGLNGWTLGYDSSSLGGRLSTVTRYDTALATNAVTTVAYGVPLSGSGLPTLSGTTPNSWAQTDLPVNGTAIFPPDHVPAGAPTSTDWPYASLTYLNVDGRQVNTADYGASAWQINSTGYDAFGNTSSELSADNRNQALTPVAGVTDPAVAAMPSSSDRARALSSVSSYSADGVDLIDSYGPTHPVMLSDNTTLVDARTHVHNVYDQGAPSGGPFHLVTSSTTSAMTLDLVDRDSHTTTSGYDPLVSGDGNGWTLRQPTSTAISGTSVTRKTRFDSTGRTIETRLPAGTANGAGQGNDARSTVTSYYTATGTGPCVSALYAGLTCQTQAAAAATGGSPTPPVLTVKTITGYNRWQQPTTATETGAAGALLRSSTSSYDTAGRPGTSHVATTTSVAGGGTSTTQIPDVTPVYDTTTGLVTSISDGTKTLSTGYDTQGRATSNTDSTGNVSTTTYDLDGRVKTRTDGKGTYTYTYDNGGGSTEHRGLLTSLDTGITAAGYSSNKTYTASYDAAGRPVTVTLPNGVVAASRFDNTGQQASLGYTGAGLGSGLLFSTDYDSLGRKTHLTGPVSKQSFTYTTVGELSTAVRTAGSSCTSQAFGYDLDSNRTGYASNSSCTPPTPTAGAHSYDTADRIVDSGTVYDELGRTTTAPSASVTGGANLGVKYFDNDMVQQQTQGTRTQTFTLDPSQHRIVGQTDSVTGTSTNHYTGGADSPAWTSNPTGYTRNIRGLNGLGAIETVAGASDTVALQLTDLNGNIISTVDDTPGATVGPGYDYDPFGASIATSPAPAKYGWLGGHQRASDDLGGLTLMGYRLYNSKLGRFLSVDPVPGGNATAYGYPTDPINNVDLDGRESRWHKIRRHAVEAAACASLGAFSCATASFISGLALGATRRLQGAMQNAVRHFIWQAMLTIMLGGGAAKKIGDAHEWGLSNDGDKAVREDTRRDLHNNRRARNYASGWSGLGLRFSYINGGVTGLLAAAMRAGIAEYRAGRLI